MRVTNLFSHAPYGRYQFNEFHLVEVVTYHNPTSGLARRVNDALNTGNFERDFRSWIVGGLALAMTFIGLSVMVDDLLNEHFLNVLVVSILPVSMLLANWLLIFRENLTLASYIVLGGMYITVLLATILSGGLAFGSYVAAPTMIVLGYIVLEKRSALIFSLCCLLVPPLGYGLMQSSWTFPAKLDYAQSTWGLARISILMCSLNPVALFLYRKSSDRTRTKLLDAQTKATQANLALSQLIAQHRSSIQLMSKMQEAGKIEGWCFDPETKLVHHTQTGANDLGMFNLNGVNTENTFDVLSRTELRQLIHRVLETEEHQNEELQTTDSSGKVRCYRHIVKIDRTLNDAIMIIGVLHDVTDINEAQAQQSQGQKLQAMGTLAAGVAHEINTPAQYVGDNIRFLQDSFTELFELNGFYSRLAEEASTGPISAETLAATANAVEQTDPEYLLEEIPAAITQSLDGITRISHIVRAMKEFSHPGGTSLEPVDLNQTIENTILVSSNEWKYSADINTHLDHNLPPVPCLPHAISQVILNLIVNAAHAIADHEDVHVDGKGVIDISTRFVADTAEIIISDNGGGIPQKLQQRIFEPFFTTKPVGQGTGQGLAMAHSTIVDKHNGELKLESQPGRTTFTIVLPLTEVAHTVQGKVA